MAAYASYRHIELDKIGNGKKRIAAQLPPSGAKSESPQHKSNQSSRITRPPGGESSDIFGPSPTTTPPGTPRKVKNYMVSNIFTPEMAGGQGGGAKTRQRPDNDSFNRLFGANGPDAADGAVSTPRGKNQPKGNIAGILNDARANGHGTNGHANGHANGHSNGHSNGTPNGSTNGTPNGSTNGTPNGTPNGTKSNGTASNGTTNGHTTNGHENGNGNGSLSSGASSSGSLTPNGSINGDAKSNGSEGGGIPLTPSRRVPPGGYSSKLW